ncbi:unnamed protein product [Sphagnum balticum]
MEFQPTEIPLTDRQSLAQPSSRTAKPPGEGVWDDHDEPTIVEEERQELDSRVDYTDKPLSRAISIVKRECEFQFNRLNIFSPVGLSNALANIENRTQKFRGLDKSTRSQVETFANLLSEIEGVPGTKTWANISLEAEKIADRVRQLADDTSKEIEQAKAKELEQAKAIFSRNYELMQRKISEYQVALSKTSKEEQPALQNEFAATMNDLIAGGEIQRNSATISTLQKKLNNLESIARCFKLFAFLGQVGWSVHAFDESTREIARVHDKLHTVGYSSAVTWLISIKVKFFKLFSLVFGYDYQFGQFSDDERYMGEFELHNARVGATIGGNLSDFNLAAGIDFGIEGGASGAYAGGKYQEWDNSLHYASTKFNELLGNERYRHIPALRRCYSRLATVNDGRSTGDKTELQNVTSVFEQYRLAKDDIAKFFRGIADTGQSSNQREHIALPSISTSDKSAYFGAKMTRKTGSAYLVAGPSSVNTNSMLPSGRLEGVLEETTLDFAKTFGFCEKLAEEQLKSKHESEKAGRELTTAVLEAQAALEADQVAPISDLVQHKTSLLGEETRLVREKELAFNNAVLKNVFQSTTDLLRAQGEKLLTTLRAHDKDWSKLDVTNPSSEHQTRLESNISDYVEMQRLSKLGAAFAKKKIEQYHKMYGADNAEGCIARMLMLNAWFYATTLADIDLDQAERDSQLRKMEALENSVMNPKFTFYDRAKLTELFSYKKEIQFMITDFRAGLSLKSWWSGNISLNYQGRVRKHTHLFRLGNTKDVTFNLGSSTSPTTKTVAEFTELLRGNVQTAPIAGDFAVVAGLTMSGTCRWYDRGGFEGLKDKPMVRLYYRKTINTDNAGIVNTGDVSVASGVDLSANFGVDKTTTTLVSDIYNHKTIFMFAMMYMHEFQAGNGNPDTGELNPGTYWEERIIVEQRESLEKLFKEIYAETQSGKQLTDGLLVEMDEIQKKFCAQHRDFDTSFKEKFIDAAKAYAVKPGLGNYNKALAAFQNLLFSYNEPVVIAKQNSALFKPGQFVVPQIQ